MKNGRRRSIQTWDAAASLRAHLTQIRVKGQVTRITGSLAVTVTQLRGALVARRLQNGDYAIVYDLNLLPDGQREKVHRVISSR